MRFLREHWVPLISVANGRNRDLASAAVLPPTTRAARRATTGGRTEDDATSIQRPPPSLPPSTASRRVSSSSASSSISSAVATSPSNGEQADSGRDYMATDGECPKEFIPSSSLIGNIFGNVDFACLAVNLAISPCARACGLRASLRPSKSPNGRQTRRWRAIAEDPRARRGMLIFNGSAKVGPPLQLQTPRRCRRRIRLELVSRVGSEACLWRVISFL